MMNQRSNGLTYEDHSVLILKLLNFSGINHVPCDILFLMSV